MENTVYKNVVMYEEVKIGASVNGEQVEVFGEQVAVLEDGREIEQYLYNIVGYTPQNGKPFVSMKANIYV